MLLALAACTGTRAVPSGLTDPADRAPNMAAFLILANGHGRGVLQTASLINASGLLESYEEWAVFEPKRGRLLEDETVYRDLLRRIRKAASRRDAIDLFIFAHDNDFVQLMDDLAPEVRSRVRLVYNAGCNGRSQYQQWLAHGVAAYVGHPDDSCSQMFVYYFQTLWWSGMTLFEAVGRANHIIYESMLDPDNMFGRACRRGGSGEAAFQSTAAQLAGNGDIRIDTPLPGSH